MFGTTLAGGAVVLHMLEYQGKWVVPMAISGFMLSAFGRAVVAYYSADAKQLKQLEDKVSGTDFITNMKGNE